MTFTCRAHDSRTIAPGMVGNVDREIRDRSRGLYPGRHFTEIGTKTKEHSGRVFEKLDWVTPMLRMWDTRREQVAAAASRRKAKWRILYRPLPTGRDSANSNRQPRGGLENHIVVRKKRQPPPLTTDEWFWPSFFRFRKDYNLSVGSKLESRPEGAGATGFFREIDRS